MGVQPPHGLAHGEKPKVAQPQFHVIAFDIIGGRSIIYQNFRIIQMGAACARHSERRRFSPGKRLPVDATEPRLGADPCQASAG